MRKLILMTTKKDDMWEMEKLDESRDAFDIIYEK